MPLVTINSISEFNQHIRSKPTVVDFTATWCGPCQQFAPKFEALARKYAHINFLKVDVDKNQDIAQQYGVRSMPTIMFFDQGRSVNTISGASKATEDAIEAFGTKHKQTSAFKPGSGHSLGGGSTSGARVNPWADPNFRPGK